MKQKLTAEQETWLKALESGDYKQGRIYLNRDNKYCCLGVGCDLFLKHTVQIDGDYMGNNTQYERCDCTAPRSLIEILKLRDKFGSPKNHSFRPLVTLNDKLKKNFAEIAKIIRDNPEEYFYE